MNYLLTTVETYRLPNDAAAERFIKEAKENPSFELVKYQAINKVKKAKGEIIDEWVRVVLTKAFNDETMPDFQIEVEYSQRT